METGFCLSALEAAFRFGNPKSGTRIKARVHSSGVRNAPKGPRGIRISMDRRGRALDNVLSSACDAA